MEDIGTKKLWALTAFFNPERYHCRLENYRLFRKRLAEQGVPLLAIECAFGRKPFQLKPEDADILIQVRSRSVLWQKERLLNIGLERLPASCADVAWLDSDIIFTDDNWAAETVKLLEKHPVIQPFSQAVFLDREEDHEDIMAGKAATGRQQESFASKYVRSRERSIDFGTAGGFAWAARRKELSSFGFYDRAVVGGADWIMAAAFIGRSDYDPQTRTWAAGVDRIIGRDLGCLPGKILHLYHGPAGRRFYRDRKKVLLANEFNPDWDLSVNSDGCLEWSATASRPLRKGVKDYFRARNEDDSWKRRFSSYLFKKNDGRPLSFCLLHIWPAAFAGLVGKKLRRYLPGFYRFLKND